MKNGVKYAYEKGFANDNDLIACESEGCLKEASCKSVSERAKERGSGQLGTLGSGNHFLEIQIIEEIFDEDKAKAFGLNKDQIVILIHTGSRGLGHQVCGDYLRLFQKSMHKYKLNIKDQELASVPIKSKEGKEYYYAMNAAANFAFTNRQMITHLTRKAIDKALNKKTNIELVYDVSHNIAKIERHIINNKQKDVLVHRKGATRAFPAGNNELSKKISENRSTRFNTWKYGYIFISTCR